MALVSVSLACACTSPREQPRSPQATRAVTTPAVAAAQTAPNQPEVGADYGIVPGHRTFDEKIAPDFYIRDPGYPPGVFAVSMPDRSRLQAFDVDSNQSSICTRIDAPPFELENHGNARYARFRCPGEWLSRDIVFLDTTQFQPTHAQQLEWSALAGPSPLPMPRAKAADLHDYAAVARPSLLDGKWLVSAAWFSGKYPPQQEPDQLRGDTIAFGHYQLLDRTLFIGDSLKPATVLYRATEPLEVREGIEWAFLPDTASEKTKARISTLYEVPNGYLIKVFMQHDHEGFGVDESTYFYAWEKGRWRLLARAERVRLY